MDAAVGQVMRVPRVFKTKGDAQDDIRGIGSQYASRFNVSGLGSTTAIKKRSGADHPLDTLTLMSFIVGLYMVDF
jgi:hypothetical protein